MAWTGNQRARAIARFMRVLSDSEAETKLTREQVGRLLDDAMAHMDAAATAYNTSIRADVRAAASVQEKGLALVYATVAKVNLPLENV